MATRGRGSSGEQFRREQTFARRESVRVREITFASRRAKNYSANDGRWRGVWRSPVFRAAVIHYARAITSINHTGAACARKGSRGWGATGWSFSEYALGKYIFHDPFWGAVIVPARRPLLPPARRTERAPCPRRPFRWPSTVRRFRVRVGRRAGRTFTAKPTCSSCCSFRSARAKKMNIRVSIAVRLCRTTEDEFPISLSLSLSLSHLQYSLLQRLK